MHDASKVLLGHTLTNFKWIDNSPGSPATFKAGLFVSRDNTGALSLLKSAGLRIGVALGKNFSNDTENTNVVRKGTKVPVRLALKRASGNVTITSYANLVSGTDDTVTIGATVFTAQAGAATPGDATFQAATSNNATATSLAAQINAHATAGALVKAVASSAVVNIYAKAGGEDGNEIALAYTDNDTNVGATVSGANLEDGSDDPDDIDFVTIGAKAYSNDLNGLADFSTTESTVTDCTYISGVLTGIDEDGSEVPVALVDMPGGV